MVRKGVTLTDVHTDVQNTDVVFVHYLGYYILLIIWYMTGISNQLMIICSGVQTAKEKHFPFPVQDDQYLNTFSFTENRMGFCPSNVLMEYRGLQCS